MTNSSSMYSGSLVFSGFLLLPETLSNPQNLQPAPLLAGPIETVQTLFKKRFDETKLTREYGFLETLKFSIVMPIKSKLSSLFRGKLGTSLTPEEQKELELYQQNQAFHKQIGKVVTAYSNYRSAILKSEFALPEQAAAVATAEHDRAQELKDSYDALLNLAADQAGALKEDDKMKTKLDSRGNDVSEDDYPYAVYCDSGVPIYIDSESLDINEARRKELHSALNLINPYIISLVHRSESMLSVVDKVKDKVNYNQEKLLDFLAQFDAKVEESLTRMGLKEGSTERNYAEKVVKKNLMQGLMAAPGFGLVKSLDALTEMSKNRNPNKINDETVQSMLEHFANELNRVGNIPLNPSSIDTPEKLAQYRVELEKYLKGIHFQGIPLINTNNSNFICSRVTSMQLNAYKLKDFEEKIESLNDEHKELTDLIAAANALIDEQVNCTVEQMFEFLPVGLADLSLIDEKLGALYKLKNEISDLRKIDSDAVAAQNKKLEEARSVISELKNSLHAAEQNFKNATAELRQKKNEKEKLEKDIKEITQTVAAKKSLKFNVKDSINATMGPQIEAIDKEITAIQERLTALGQERAMGEIYIGGLAEEYIELENELANLKTNGINKVHRDTLEAAVQEYDADKTSTVTLAGGNLLELKEKISNCCANGVVAEYLAFVDQANTKANELFMLAENTAEQLAFAKTDLMCLKRTIVNGGNLNIDVDELTKVNELAIIPEKFFTEQEQQNMVTRLGDSRTRTLDLTYKISKKLLDQGVEDNIHRPYVKDQTAKQRDSETAALAGGLSRSGEKAHSLYQTISSGYGPEDNGSDESGSSARSSLDGFGESYALALKTPTVYPPPLTQSFENSIENCNDEEFYSDVEDDEPFSSAVKPKLFTAPAEFIEVKIADKVEQSGLPPSSEPVDVTVMTDEKEF
jgi:predicted  nucleic acid-binding Zn-ribbon protein